MFDTLRNLIAPGGRVRISPYAQDAQLQVLFGEAPDPKNRQSSLVSLLKRNNQNVQALADTYIDFAKSGRHFTPEKYCTDKFLQLYLAYYFTTNISKIQLCMLDLVETNRIPDKLTIVDIGVGPGVTAVAVLDFLIAWSTTCHLFGQPFPIEALEIRCYDVSQPCLRIAQQVVSAYCETITKRYEYSLKENSISHIIKHIAHWGMSAKWMVHDMSNGGIRHGNGEHVLMFASNILTELTANGKKALADSISTMGLGSIANIIEPGDNGSCIRLNTWRSSFLKDHVDFSALFPCEVHAGANLDACSGCWNARRESLHEPLLY